MITTEIILWTGVAGFIYCVGFFGGMCEDTNYDGVSLPFRILMLASTLAVAIAIVYFLWKGITLS